MKRRALLAHLRKHGCYLKREGRSRSLWTNPATGHVEAMVTSAPGHFDALVHWCYCEGKRSNRTTNVTMARLTLTLPDDLHRALKESAARRDTTIGELVAESLEFYGIKTASAANELVAAARAHSGLSEDEATALAVEETRAERTG